MDSTSDQKDLGNVIRGHKANLHNPNTSQEAKKHSKEVLEELGIETSGFVSEISGPDVNIEGKNPGNVAGGYKATLHNPNVSEKAKERAQEKLEEMGAK
ncbi:Conidiation protein 6-domain-containing protein [Tuber borchii]|uniref:Conidiation protein 6-domain-containing protein n=1 Tax=Tuber borchii TaxID=42251 RepID=A0A2T6ZSC1_TUBBO|nr:Conidiation protein 6-domain-containing protein [Tuber borchii]